MTIIAVTVLFHSFVIIDENRTEKATNELLHPPTPPNQDTHADPLFSVTDTNTFLGNGVLTHPDKNTTLKKK